MALNRPRQAHAERLRRKLERPLSGRVPQRQAVLNARRGPQRHHLMEGRLQRSSTALGAWQHAPSLVRNEIHAGKKGRLRAETKPRTRPQTGENTGLRPRRRARVDGSDEEAVWRYSSPPRSVSRAQ